MAEHTTATNKKEDGMREGDLIECCTSDELVEMMYELAAQDIDTDFVYEVNGEKGYWLKVVRVGEKKN